MINLCFAEKFQGTSVPVPVSGQCGQRNAHGVNGRIAGAIPSVDGDTDFGNFGCLNFGK